MEELTQKLLQISVVIQLQIHTIMYFICTWVKEDFAYKLFQLDIAIIGRDKLSITHKV